MTAGPATDQTEKGVTDGDAPAEPPTREIPVTYLGPGELPVPQVQARITYLPPGEQARGKRQVLPWEKLLEIFSKPKAPASAAGKESLPSWCAATFEDNRRKIENAERACGLVLDFDNSPPELTKFQERGYPVRQTPLDEALSPWPGARALVYTSFSHLTEAKGNVPKFRVVLPYSRDVSKEEHEIIWQATNDRLLALGQLTDQSAKDISRRWYVPSRTPTFESRLQEGAYLDPDVILAEARSSAPAGDPQDFSFDDDDLVAADRWAAVHSIPEYQRLALASKALAKLPGSTEGEGGHNALLVAASLVVIGFSIEDEDRAFELLSSEFNPRCEPPWDERDIRHKIKDAAKNSLGQVPGYRIKIKAKPKDEPDNVVQLSVVRDAQAAHAVFPFTDLGNAELLVAKHGDRIRYQVDAKKWLVWSGQRWMRDESLEIERIAGETIRAYALDVTGLTREQVKAKRAWTKKSESERALRAMVKLAAPLAVITSAQLDQHAWKLNVSNGTIDLTTGALGPHRREDYITQLAPVPYHPDADTGIVDSFLMSVQPDLQMRGYLWRRFGYCLTADNSAQTFWIDYGSGANGKSTLVEAIHAVLGDYAEVLPIQALLAHRGEFHPTEQTLLFGKRFVSASEPEKGAPLNMTFIKQFTGGGQINARKMGQDFSKYKPRAKVLLECNSKPPIKDPSDGAWRRIHLVSWPVRLRKSADLPGSAPVVDLTLPERLATKGAPGLLLRLVKGLRDYQRAKGFQPPPSVLADTDEYRQGEAPPVSEFIADCLSVDPSATEVVPVTDIHKAYVTWAEGEGIPSKFHLSKQKLTKELNEQTVGQHHVANSVRGRIGVRLIHPVVTVSGVPDDDFGSDLEV